MLISTSGEKIPSNGIETNLGQDGLYGNLKQSAGEILNLFVTSIGGKEIPLEVKKAMDRILPG